jgi:hypothetical protein
VFGILTGPVAAVPGKTLFEAVSGPLRDPERQLVAGRETPVIDPMQDAFYSRAKADEPRRCTGCRHAAEATEATEAAA